MNHIFPVLLLFGALTLPALALEERATPEKVTIEGTVATVSLVAGKGLCFLTVKPGFLPVKPGLLPAQQAEATQPVVPERKVILGSMRYLIDKGFNPRAGDAIKVTGFPLADKSLAAAHIDLPARKQSLQLRDDAGRPLWSSGRGTGLGLPGIGGPGSGGPGMGGAGRGRGPRSRGGGR